MPDPASSPRGGGDGGGGRFAPKMVLSPTVTTAPVPASAASVAAVSRARPLARSRAWAAFCAQSVEPAREEERTTPDPPQWGHARVREGRAPSEASLCELLAPPKADANAERKAARNACARFIAWSWPWP